MRIIKEKKEVHKDLFIRHIKTEEKINEKEFIINLIMRYALAFLFSLGSFWIFYVVFTPLTFYPSALILKILYNATIEAPFILLGKYTVFIDKACVAGSAYFLMFLINMATHGISWPKRIKIVLLNFGSLLILNILRIGFLAILLLTLPGLYDVTHFIFWHVISTVFVIAIWLFTSKAYKIYKIPFFSVWMIIKNMIKKKK